MKQVTGEDVIVPFKCDIEEEMAENAINNQFFLDLLAVLWENIVSEVPIRCTKEETMPDLKGDGWSLEE